MLPPEYSKHTFKTLCALCLAICCIACSDSSDRRTVEVTPPSPPPPPLQSRYELSSPDSVPEGVAFDPQDRAFYATSLQGGSITRIDADGTETLFREADNRAQLIGAKVDARTRRLWVCARQVDGIDHRVWVFDLDSHEQVMEFLLAALASNGSCNDLALDDTGIAYVTDSSNPNIYRLDPATEEGSILISDPLLTDDLSAGLGSNGIAVSEDQTTLLVGKFAPAKLIAISLPLAESLVTVTLQGDKIPSHDGLIFLGEDLYSVSDSTVSRIVFDPDSGFSSGTVVNSGQIGGLSTATIAEGEVYAIKSEVFNFALGQPLNPPFEIFRVEQSGFE